MIKLAWLVVAVSSASTASACGKPKGHGADDFIIDSVNKDLKEVDADVAAGKYMDAGFACAGNLGTLPRIAKADAELAARVKQVCGHDVPLATLKAAVEKTEAARKAKPDEKVLSECYNADVKGASDDLDKNQSGDDASKALLARFAAACPK